MMLLDSSAAPAAAFRLLIEVLYRRPRSAWHACPQISWSEFCTQLSCLVQSILCGHIAAIPRRDTAHAVVPLSLLHSTTKNRLWRTSYFHSLNSCTREQEIPLDGVCFSQASQHGRHLFCLRCHEAFYSTHFSAPPSEDRFCQDSLFVPS